MSDWHDDDFNDDWVPKAAPSEGVRVVGEPDVEPPPAPRAGAPRRPGGRFPLPGETGDRAEPAPRPRRPGRDDSSTELPHWTEPPTGQLPRVLGGAPDDDFEPWAQVSGPSGPRFRTGEADWADGDWGEGELLKDETMGVGALDDSRDQHDEFAPPRRARRGRRGRARGEDTPPGPPPVGPGSLEGPAAEHHEGYQGGYAEGYEGGYAEGYEYEGYEEEGAGPEVGPRLITGIIVAGVCLAAFAAGETIAMILVTVLVGLCSFELYTAFQRAGYQPATLLGLLGSAALVPLGYEQGERGILMGFFLVSAFTFLWYLFEVVHARPTVNIGLTLLPVAWVGIFGAYAGSFLADPVNGTGFLLGVAICAVGSDVVGFFVGRSMGRTPLMPRVSPNKTVEGLVAGAITAVVLGGVVGSVLHPWADKGIGAGIVLGILVAITAPLGDLAESMIKRDLGIKDLGGVLPGHGGFLDRFDAILFTLPLAFYWALHLFT